MLRLLHARLTAAVLLVAVSACARESTVVPGARAELKVVHATSTLGALDVAVGNETLIRGLTFGHSSAPTLVPAGGQRISVRAGATAVGEIHTTLTTDHINAITVTNGVVQVTGAVTPDTGVAATNRANIRLINVVGPNTSDPTRLHVLINSPGVPPDSVATIGLDTRIASHGPLMYFDPGHFRFRFVSEDDSKSLLGAIEFDVAAGEKRAVVLERDAAGVYRVQVVTEP